MSIVLIDGFDHYPTSSASNLSQSGWSMDVGIADSSPAPRLGSGKFLKFDVPGTDLVLSLPEPQQSIIFGTAVYLPYRQSNLFYLLYPSGNVAFVIATNASHQLALYKGSVSPGNLMATGLQVLPRNTWFYIEVKLTISDVGGNVECRLNGSPVADCQIYGVNTQVSTSETTVSSLVIVSPSRVLDRGICLDDLYVLNPFYGDAPTNTFLGDVRVQTLVPTSDASVAFSHVGAGSNTAAVAGDYDGDTTYAGSSTSGASDLFNMSNLSGTPQVFGVAVYTMARKDDAGFRGIKPKISSSGVAVTGPAVAVDMGYKGTQQIFEQDPNTSSPWTAGSVNAALIGYEAS